VARQPRFVLPGQPQHVIQRGNNHAIIFTDDSDHLYYLEILAEACERHDCKVHAYVLMSNHVHLLITPVSETGISLVMQSLGRRYVQYFNYRYTRTGTMWEGRYKATLLDTEQYLLACHRYIELNPVRAGMVGFPGDYRWSSFRFNALGMPDALITHHEIYQALGSDDVLRQQRYRALFDHCIDPTVIDGIREATNKGWVLGNDRFKEQIGVLLGRQLEPKCRGGDRKSNDFRNDQTIHKINRV
jgi:putative transposase